MNYNLAGKIRGMVVIYVILAFSLMVLGGQATSSLPSCPTNGNIDSPVLYIDKVLVSGDTNPPIRTMVYYMLRIDVRYCDSTSISDVKVTDAIPALYDVDSASATKGTVTLGKGGGSATTIKWDINAMGPGETQSLTIDLHTGLRQKGSSGKLLQHFNSPGTYSLNEGASVTGFHSASDKRIKAGPTPPITVVAS